MPTNILSLPPELQCVVASRVDDCCNPRLTCRELSAACLNEFILRYIKERKHLHSKRGLQALADISAHPAFAGKIETIGLVALPAINSVHVVSTTFWDWFREDCDFKSSREDVRLLISVLDNIGGAGGAVSLIFLGYGVRSAFGKRDYDNAQGSCDCYSLGGSSNHNRRSILRAIHVANAITTSLMAKLELDSVALDCVDAGSFPPPTELRQAPWRNVKVLEFRTENVIDSEFMARVKDYLASAEALQSIKTTLSQNSLEADQETLRMLALNTDSGLHRFEIWLYQGQAEPLLNFLLKFKSSWRDLSICSTRLPSSRIGRPSSEHFAKTSSWSPFAFILLRS